jgi:glycosyltransferase involved in cell wall biosynthesis
MLAAPFATGVATYARTLAATLPAAGFETLVLEGAEEPPAATRWARAARPGLRRGRLATAPGAAGGELFREAQVYFNLHGRLMPVACEQPPEVMHWTYPVPLYMPGVRNLYTVHDLIPLTQPGLTRISRRRHTRLLRAITARADRIVTVSETVRQEIVDVLGLSPARVVNAWQAAAPAAEVPSPPELRPGGYFLACGLVEPRKNLLRLARAHALSGAAEPLVIAGPSAPGHARLESQLRACPGVVRLGWWPRAELDGLIRGCRALLHPSLAEGFGLPIAEAMTLGAPVLASACGASAEIAGAAAWLADPEDVADIARGIAALAADEALRLRLRTAGLQRARLFSVAAYAGRLRRLYGDLLADAPAAAA